MTKLISLALSYFSSTHSNYLDRGSVTWNSLDNRLVGAKTCCETQRGTSENLSRPVSSADSSYFPVHLSIWTSPSTLVKDKTHLFFLLQQFYYLLSLFLETLSQSLSIRPLPAEFWVREVHAYCLLLEYPKYRSRRWHVYILPVLDRP